METTPLMVLSAAVVKSDGFAGSCDTLVKLPLVPELASVKSSLKSFASSELKRACFMATAVTAELRTAVPAANMMILLLNFIVFVVM